MFRDRILSAGGGRVRKIILFGSRARGDARPDSDYDLLIVLGGDGEWDGRKWSRVFRRALSGLGLTLWTGVEPHVMRDVTFEEEKDVIGGLAYPANREGVILYENA